MATGESLGGYERFVRVERGGDGARGGRVRTCTTRVSAHAKCDGHANACSTAPRPSLLFTNGRGAAPTAGANASSSSSSSSSSTSSCVQSEDDALDDELQRGVVPPPPARSHVPCRDKERTRLGWRMLHANYNAAAGITQ